MLVEIMMYFFYNLGVDTYTLKFIHSEVYDNVLILYLIGHFELKKPFYCKSKVFSGI